MSLRILHVIDSMDPASGGAPAAIRQLIPHMREIGVDAEVVCFDGDTDGSGVHDSFPMHRLGPGKGPWRYHPKFRAWLGRALPHFDACIVHGLWLYNGYATTKAARRLRSRTSDAAPRVLVMPHGMLDPWFQQAAHRRIKALRNRLWWALVERATLRRSDGLLFTSQEERRLASLVFQDLPSARGWVIGLGTDGPPEWQPSRRNAFREACPGVGEKPFLLYMGRIDPKKGIDILMDAWGDLLRASQDRGDMPWLVIAGPGWETPYGRALLAKRSGDPLLAAGVLTTGMLAGDAKWGALIDCEAFILTSHQENFGVTVAEALSCGRPVLVSRGVNIHATVTNTRSGLTCSPGRMDVRRMLTEWMSMDGNARDRMSVAAIDAWRAHFTLHETARRLVEALTVEVSGTDA
ncbi:MAG: glycosyltransferase [Chitinophagia bacterium]|nr:glycosyltransferase [Chitinophagia bacterium]